MSYGTKKSALLLANFDQKLQYLVMIFITHLVNVSMFQMRAKGAAAIYGYLSVVGKNAKTINESKFLRKKT